MIRLEIKNYDMILIERVQKYQPYQAKLTSILTGEKIFCLIKNK